MGVSRRQPASVRPIAGPTPFAAITGSDDERPHVCTGCEPGSGASSGVWPRGGTRESCATFCAGAHSDAARTGRIVDRSCSAAARRLLYELHELVSDPWLVAGRRIRGVRQL